MTVLSVMIIITGAILYNADTLWVFIVMYGVHKTVFSIWGVSSTIITNGLSGNINTKMKFKAFWAGIITAVLGAPLFFIDYLNYTGYFLVFITILCSATLLNFLKNQKLS